MPTAVWLVLVVLILAMWVPVRCITTEMRKEEQQGAAWSSSTDAVLAVHTAIYPKSVPVYPHRRDRFTQELVSRGRIYELGGLAPLALDKRVSLAELRRVLQCSGDEPDLVGDRGTLHMIRMVPPTRETTRLVAVWAETGCEDWQACHVLLQKFDKREEGYGAGPRQSRDGGKMTSPFQVRLLRVTNGSLFFDWPFDNRQRFGPVKDFISPHRHLLLHLALSKVHPADLGDSLFLFGEEVAYLPFHVPFFAFSASPSMRSADLPWPWRAHQVSEVALYKEYVDNPRRDGTHAALPQLLAQLNNHSEAYNSLDEAAWQRRKPKAAFYGAMSSLRHVFFDVAAANPALFDVGWTGGINSKPWNPLSDEPEIPFDDMRKHFDRDRNFSTPGFLKALLASHLFEGHDVHLYPTLRTGGPPEHTNMYKYLVVLVGGSGFASADRLAAMMLHSGAVILLQKHDFEYHFSSRLKPWVHYVPLSFSAADAADKVRWLQNNDRMARQLAHNARTFALSHLRLEDLVCYAAAALNTMSAALAGSSAIWPFEPVELPYDAEL